MISELQLLKGMPIEVESFKVYPLTLEEIVNMGEDKYNLYLQSLMITKSNIDKEFINQELYDEFLKMDDFEFLLILMLQNEEIHNIILTSLSLFLKENVNFDVENGLFVQREYDSFIISNDIYNQIKETICLQNYINKDVKKEEEEFNPYDDKARELIEKRNKFKKMLQERNAEDGLNLSDIVSIVASHSPTINFLNVWDLTIYHLYTIYVRMAMKDQYETQIYLLPHSSDNKSSEFKHWMSKIIKNN